MKFRTEIELHPLARPMEYADRILCLGSCFAEHIANLLGAMKFHITANPTGIVFNPISMVAALQSALCPEEVRQEELMTDGERWFHLGFHGSFSAPDPQQALERMNAGRHVAAQALAEADFLILTFGTAWVYEYRGDVVANCHRLPAECFTRRRLRVEEIVEACGALFGGALADKEIILTVSPVRHLNDGLAGNSVSKAILRLAAEELQERYPRVHYFPAYEIMVDDLRDYRFYADDLVHPASQAVAYVRECFVRYGLSPEAVRLLPEVDAIVRAAHHRPENPQSASHQAFCRRMLQRIETLPQIDLSAERSYFHSALLSDESI